MTAPSAIPAPPVAATPVVPAKAAEQMVSTFLMRDPGGYSVEFFRFNKRD